MDKIKVGKGKLIAILVENRDKHAKDYEEAVGGYYIQAEKEFEAELAKIKDGEKFSTYFRNLSEPESHVKEYDNVIEMLGVSEDEQIYISMQDYLKYYKNEWDWQSSWEMSNRPYATLYNVAGVGNAKPKSLK